MSGKTLKLNPLACAFSREQSAPPIRSNWRYSHKGWNANGRRSPVAFGDVDDRKLPGRDP